MATRENSDRSTYDRIAESWYRLRHRTRFRKELAELATRWGRGRLLNVGCGHGPDFIPFKDSFEMWGLDSSVPMISMAARHAQKYQLNAHLLVGDAVCLPFKRGIFDWAIAVASYHHVRGKSDRLTAFRELRRVLTPGGEVFVTVWNRWQRRFVGKGSEVVLPWRAGEFIAMRYYYLFTYAEITRLMKKAGFQVIKAYPEWDYRFPVKYFSQNICVLARST